MLELWVLEAGLTLHAGEKPMPGRIAALKGGLRVSASFGASLGV